MLLSTRWLLALRRLLCLQKISEFGSAETLIHSADLNGIVQTRKLSEVLPYNFSAGDIKHA